MLQEFLSKKTMHRQMIVNFGQPRAALPRTPKGGPTPTRRVSDPDLIKHAGSFGIQRGDPTRLFLIMSEWFAAQRSNLCLELRHTAVVTAASSTAALFSEQIGMLPKLLSRPSQHRRRQTPFCLREGDIRSLSILGSTLGAEFLLRGLTAGRILRKAKGAAGNNPAEWREGGRDKSEFLKEHIRTTVHPLLDNT